MDWLSNSISSATSIISSTVDSSTREGNESYFSTERLSSSVSGFTPSFPDLSKMNVFGENDPTSPKKAATPAAAAVGTAASTSFNPSAASNSRMVTSVEQVDLDDDEEEKKDNFDSSTNTPPRTGTSLDHLQAVEKTEQNNDNNTRRGSASDIIANTVGSVQNLLHQTENTFMGHGHGGGARRGSTFGESILRPGHVARQSTVVDLSTGTKMKRKKIQHVNLVPESLRVNTVYNNIWICFFLF
jgi:hypothetical protein